MITWAAVHAMPAQRMIDTVLVAAIRKVAIAGPAESLVARDRRGAPATGHCLARISRYSRTYVRPILGSGFWGDALDDHVTFRDVVYRGDPEAGRGGKV